MFCACVGILICLVVIIIGAAISSVDVVKYDFGLYYILLAIVALMGSLTLCVIRPTKFCGVRDPRWYTDICERIHRALILAQEKRLLAQQMDFDMGEAGSIVSAGTTATSKTRGGARQHQRATLMMLGPAVELMHHVIHGVTENTNDEEEDDEEKSKAKTEELKQAPVLWWDSYEAEKNFRLPRRKKRRRSRKKKIENDLYTIPSVSSDMVAVVTCQPQNNVNSAYLQMPYQNVDNEVNGYEDGTSEVFL